MPERSLAGETSRKEFEENKAQRKAGKAPDPYVVRVWATSERRKRIAIEVHADDIPGPQLSRGKLGASFGILLNAPAQEVTPTLQLVTKSVFASDSSRQRP